MRSLSFCFYKMRIWEVSSRVSLFRALIKAKRYYTISLIPGMFPVPFQHKPQISFNSSQCILRNNWVSCLNLIWVWIFLIREFLEYFSNQWRFNHENKFGNFLNITVQCPTKIQSSIQTSYAHCVSKTKTN